MNWFPATTIHGDKTQREGEMTLRTFKSGKKLILAATDVAARSLDIPHVAHVVNIDLLNDIDDYIHQIERTGRARKTGLATAFFNENNLSMARLLAELMQEENQEVPAWLTRYASRAPVSGGKNRQAGGGGRSGGHDYRRDDSFSNGPSTDGVNSSSGYGVHCGYSGGYGPAGVTGAWD